MKTLGDGRGNVLRAAMAAAFTAACLALWGCEQGPVSPGNAPDDPSDIVDTVAKADTVTGPITDTPSTKVSVFPQEGHQYLYLSRRTHPTIGPPAVQACSLWISHARSPYAPRDHQDTVFRVQERRACYTTSSSIEHGVFSSVSESVYYLLKGPNSAQSFDTTNGVAGLQAKPPFDWVTVTRAETRKVSFYGDSLALAGGTRNDLFLEGKGRLLYSRVYPSVYQNWYGSFEELRLLRYDGLEVTDSLVEHYLNP